MADADPAGSMDEPSPRRGRRARLLEAAMDEFARNGYAGTTIREIERRVGFVAGTGSLYRHFPSKAALLKEAVAYEVARCRAEIEEQRASLPDEPDPVARRQQRYRAILHDMTRWERLFNLMLKEGDRVPELAEAVWAAVQRPIEGDPEHPENVADAIAMTSLGGYHFFSLMQGRPFNGIHPDRLIEVLTDITAPVVDGART